MCVLYSANHAFCVYLINKRNEMKIQSLDSLRAFQQKLVDSFFENVFFLLFSFGGGFAHRKCVVYIFVFFQLLAKLKQIHILLTKERRESDTSDA